MSLKRLLAGTVLAGAMSLTGGAVSAAPVLSSNVDGAVFAAALGATTGWTYLGQNTAAFTGAGTAEIEMRDADYANSFGYGSTAHGSMTTVFTAGAPTGTTASISGLSPSYLFWFESDSQGNASDNRQWTDGTGAGGPNGDTEGDIDIFLNAALQKWAFFFDDSGPNGNPDDNDYNDMVVSFTQGTTRAVPEPTSLALLGLGLLAAGGWVRKNRKA